MAKGTINQNTWYTLTDLVTKNIFPWCNKDIRKYRRMVEADKKGRNYLKAIVIGNGGAKRYTFKGENIINFIAQVEDKGLDL